MARHLPLLAALLMTASGCVIHTHGTTTVRTEAYAAPTYVTVSSPPPPLRQAVQVRPTKPQANAVWISGYWSLEAGRWVWVDGHWSTPRPGYEWEPPVCVSVAGGGYQYHPGYWRARNDTPPPVYRARGTIRVHVVPPDREPAVVRVRPAPA